MTPKMSMSSVALIGVPSSAGGRRTGQEMGPAAFRRAGLLQRLGDAGLDVADFGDLPPVCFHPDPDHPQQQNLALVAGVARQVDGQINRALREGRAPLVLGGDCSLSLGVIAGMLRHHARLGLVYFDADLDLNTPQTTLSGVFDGMVLAHALGRGAPRLTGIGPRQPMLSEENIALFGYDVESGWIDPHEIDALATTRMARFPLDRVRESPATAAREALRGLHGLSDAILVHFDIDVTDLPAVDVPHPGGLDADSAFAALNVLVADPKCAGLVVTELNAELDPDGSCAERLVTGLVSALAPNAAWEV